MKKPENWPKHHNPLSDEEALIIAELVLSGHPVSYIEGAERLAKYILALQAQAEDIEKMIDEQERDTLPEIGLLHSPAVR
jgi:hypothetical protein